MAGRYFYVDWHSGIAGAQIDDVKSRLFEQLHLRGVAAFDLKRDGRLVGLDKNAESRVGGYISGQVCHFEVASALLDYFHASQRVGPTDAVLLVL